MLVDCSENLATQIEEITFSPSCWKSPTLDGQFTPFALHHALAGSLPAIATVTPPKSLAYQPSLPTEIWDEIAQQVRQGSAGRKAANKTLMSLSLVCRRFTLPAQRALFHSVKLYEPKQIDRLVVTLLGKPYLGQCTRVLEVKVAKPDIYA
jgi:hypothetical protein